VNDLPVFIPHDPSDYDVHTMSVRGDVKWINGHLYQLRWNQERLSDCWTLVDGEPGGNSND